MAQEQGTDPRDQILQQMQKDLGMTHIPYEKFSAKFDEDPKVRETIYRDLGLKDSGVTFEAYEAKTSKKKVPTEVDSTTGGEQEISSLGSADSLLRSSEEAVEKPSIPALEMPDTTMSRDVTAVAPKQDLIAKGYSPEEVQNQNNAFDTAYKAVKDHAVKPRKDAPKLVSERDEVEELDEDLVEVAVEAAGKKFNLSGPEKTNLLNRIKQTYQGEPSGEKARIAAGMEFKEKYGATPAEFNKFTFEKKAEGINAAAETEVANINGAAKTAVTELDNSTVTANEELLKKYQAIAATGEVPPEQVQAAFQNEQAQLIRAHADQRKNIQSRYLKEFNDATQKAEAALQELYMDDTGSMTEEQKKVYAESYNKNFAAAEKIRNKGMQQMLRNKPMYEEIQIAFGAGVGDLYSSIGGALGMAGLEDANYKITRAVERVAAESGSDIALEPEGLGDASWWVANGVRTAPMMLALAPVGMVGGGVVATGARLSGASARYTALAGSVGGGLVSWKAETMMEQALGFQQAIADGKTPEQAADIAVNIGKLNLATIPLQMMELAPFFHKMPLAVGATVGVLAGSSEEVLQGWATNKAMAMSEKREYTFQDYLKDPETGVTAVLGGAMSAPFVIGGAVKNAQDKRNFIGGTVRNLVHEGSYAKASGAVQAAFDNGTIDEKTLADFNIAIQAAANAAPQVVSIEDPHTSAAVEQNLVDAQILQQQAATSPPGPVQDALNQQAEQKTLEVQAIVTDMAPLFTVQTSTDSAPRVMTESMMNDFLEDPEMIEAISEGEINVTVRNNPQMEKRVTDLVEKQRKQKQEAVQQARETMGEIADEGAAEAASLMEMKQGTPITYQGQEGVLSKDKDTGENIFTTPAGKETIISGGGDQRPLAESGVQVRSAKKVSLEGKDYYVISEGGQPKVFVRSDKGKMVESPVGKAKKEQIISLSNKAKPAAAPEPVSEAPVAAETPAEPVSSDGAEINQEAQSNVELNTQTNEETKTPEAEVLTPAPEPQVPAEAEAVTPAEPEKVESKKIETDEKSTNKGGDQETGSDTKVAPSGKSQANKGIGKGRVKKANRKLKDPNYLAAAEAEASNPHDQTLQYFISGGTISTEVVQKIFGSGDKKVAGEKRKRIGITNNKTGAKSVDALAHYLWENQAIEGQFDVIDFRNAVIDVLSSHNSTGTMVKEFLDNNRIEKSKEEEYWRGQLTDQEREDMDIDIMIEDYYDSLSEAEKEALFNNSGLDESAAEDVIIKEQETQAPDSTADKELQAKNLIAKGVDGILNKLGGVKNLTEQERTTILQDLKNILEGAIKLGGYTLKKAIDDLLSDLKSKGAGKITDEDLTFFRDNLEGKEQILPEEKPKKTRKQAATFRAYMGNNGEQIKKELQDLGLDYNQMDNEESAIYAEEIMRRYGKDIGLQAIRDRVIEDQPAIHLYGKIIDAIGVEISKETDPGKKAALIRHQANLIKEVGDYLTAGGQRSQAAREMYKNSDFGYLPGSLRERAKDANKDGAIPPDVFASIIAKMNQMAAELEAVNEQLKAKEDERAAAAGELAFERIKNEALEAEKKASWSDKAKKLADRVDKGKLNRPSSFMMATPGSLAWDGALEAVKKTIIATGKAADAIAAGIDYIRNTDWYKKLTSDKQNQAEDDFNKYFRDNPLEDAKDDEETITIDSETNRLDIPFALLKRLIKEGAKDIEDLTNRVHEMIKEEFPDLTHRDVRDAISKYGVTSKPSDNPIRKKLAQLKRDGQLLSAYEDVQSGKQPEKSGHQKSKPGQWQREMLRKIKDLLKNFPQDQAALDKRYATAQDRITSALKNRIQDLEKQIDTEKREARNNKLVEYNETNKRLKKEVEELEQALTDIVGPKTLSHEDRVDRAVSRLEKSIEELDEDIAAYNLTYKTKPEKLHDPIIEALKAVKKSKKELLEQMRYAVGEAEAHRVKLYKDRLKQQIAKLEKKLADKDYTKPTKKEIQLDRETKALEVEKIRIKDEIEFELEKIRRANRSPLDIFYEDYLLEAVGLLRGAATSLDLSAIGRQGFPLAIRNPRLAYKAFRASLEFMADKEKAEAYERAVRSSPYYYDMKKAGLELTFSSPKLSAKEEGQMSRLISKIPLLAHSNRAYVGFLNKLRVDVFLDAMALVDKAGLTGSEREETLKGFAKMTNILSGRGNLPKSMNQYLPAMNAIFFASKFFISRFQMLGYGITEAVPGKWNRLPKMASTEFRKTLFANLGFYLGLYTIAKLFGADVEDDPRSSDFGKIKVGDTRFDQLVGLQQIIVLAARFATLSTKNSTTGEVRPLNSGSFKDKTLLDVGTDFLENKFAPVPAITLEAMRGKFRYEKKNALPLLWGGSDVLAEKGDDFSLGPAVANNLSPMWFSDIPEIWRNDGPAKAVASGTASFFGSGVQNYQASIMDKAQREVSDALQKKLAETPADKKLQNFDIDQELVAIREKYKNDPEFNSREFNKRIGDVFTLQRMKGKPDWYRDVFYAGSNEDKAAIIRKESPTTEELHKNVDELVATGVISEKVKYEALEDKEIKDLTSRLSDQEFNNLREKYRMEMLYDKMMASKLLVADLTKGKSDIRKLVQKHKKEAMGFAAELAMQLGVENGARAQYVFDTMNDLNLSDQEKNEWLTSMALNKVISEQVAEQWAVLELQKALKEQEKNDQVDPAQVIQTTLQDTIRDVEVPQMDVEN